MLVANFPLELGKQLGRIMSEDTKPKIDLTGVPELEEMAQSGQYSSGMIATLASIGRSIKSRDIQEAAQRFDQIYDRREEEEKKQKKAQVIQLPIWPENTAGTPDCFLRSALFAATDRGQGYYTSKTPINTVAGYQIRYQGNQLTQSHLVVWEALVRLARQHPLGDECLFKGHTFLRGLGYKGKIGESAYKWLDSIIADLTACVVEVDISTKYAYGAGLIEWYARENDTRAFKIKLNRGLIALYGHGNWTQIQWQQRLTLKNHPLALWLHGYYSTHAAPYPVSVSFIREKSGSGIKELYRFRQSLRKALEKIKAEGVIAEWEIIKKTDLVNVVKVPTQAQSKHLSKSSKSK